MFAAFKQRVHDPQSLFNSCRKEAVLFNPELIAGPSHLKFAEIHTTLALEREENIAREYAIEFLVRLSGKKQIEKALEIGIQKGTYIGVLAGREIVALLQGYLSPRDDSLLEITEEKEKIIRKFFEVSGSGKTLQKNIFEKIALLSVY